MKRIPESKYIVEHGTRCVTARLIEEHHSTDEVERFHRWFVGQTGIVLSDGTCGIYVSDYERWLAQGKRTRQSAEDWD